MENNHYVRGMMRQGKNHYCVYKPDGQKIIGLPDVYDAVNLAYHFDLASGIPPLEHSEYERAVWNYSNGI